MTTKKQEVRKVPNLRFPGFEGEWEEHKLSELGSFIGGGTPTSTNLEFWNGKFPWVSSSDLVEDNIHYVRINRFITQDAIDNSATKLCKAPVILIVSRVGVGKVAYTTKDVCTSQDFTNIIDIKCNGVFLSFLLSNVMKMQAANVQGTSIKGISSAEIKSISVFVPKDNEQLYIADFLSLIEERIQCQIKIIEGLKSFKSAVSKKIFSQELRFKDENGDEFEEWKEVSLGDITFKVGKKNKNNIQYPIYSINNKAGFVPQSEQFEGMDSNQRGYDISLYKIIEENTFAYNPARINVGSLGYSGNLNNIIISSLYVCFKTTETVNDNFLLQYFNTPEFNFMVNNYTEGGVRQYLFYENFSIISLNLPSKPEQTKIANFLSGIDDKIDIETSLLQQLKQQKQYFLQQMFI